MKYIYTYMYAYIRAAYIWAKLISEGCLVKFSKLILWRIYDRFFQKTFHLYKINMWAAITLLVLLPRHSHSLPFSHITVSESCTHIFLYAIVTLLTYANVIQCIWMNRWMCAGAFDIWKLVDKALCEEKFLAPFELSRNAIKFRIKILHKINKNASTPLHLHCICMYIAIKMSTRTYFHH